MIQKKQYVSHSQGAKQKKRTKQQNKRYQTAHSCPLEHIQKGR